MVLPNIPHNFINIIIKYIWCYRQKVRQICVLISQCQIGPQSDAIFKVANRASRLNQVIDSVYADVRVRSAILSENCPHSSSFTTQLSNITTYRWLYHVSVRVSRPWLHLFLVLYSSVFSDGWWRWPERRPPAQGELSPPTRLGWSTFSDRC